MTSQTRSPTGALVRSAGAILAGLVVVAVTTTASDQMLHASGVFPP